MTTLLKILAAFLLIFNGIGALYGGWHLMNQPDGTSIELSSDWLKHTPFENYFIPGLVLFIANGIFSFMVLLAILLKNTYYPWLVMIQGAILTGWLIIQMLMIQTVYFLHFIMGSVGILLLVTGWLLLKRE